MGLLQIRVLAIRWRIPDGRVMAQKCLRTRSNGAGVGSESTTDEWRRPRVGKIGKPSPSNSIAEASIAEASMWSGPLGSVWSGGGSGQGPRSAAGITATPSGRR